MLVRKSNTLNIYRKCENSFFIINCGLKRNKKKPVWLSWLSCHLLISAQVMISWLGDQAPLLALRRAWNLLEILSENGNYKTDSADSCRFEDYVNAFVNYEVLHEFKVN